MDIAPSVCVTSGLIRVMVNAVTKASRRLLRDFSELDHLRVSKKGVKDFLTSADLSSEKVLVRELSAAHPEYSILSEEMGLKPGQDSQNCWIIDPLDGTVNFMKGVPYWCISAALKCDNKIKAGVIFDPLRNEVFFAEAGKGAFLNNRRLRLSPVHYLDDALVSFSGINDSIVAKIFDKCLSGRKMGSTALSLAYVAAGRFDAFIRKGGTTEWDTAAGMLIASEAGAVARSDVKDSLHARSLMVSGPDIADEFSALVEL